MPAETNPAPDGGSGSAVENSTPPTEPGETELALALGDSRRVRPSDMPAGPVGSPIASVDGAGEMSLDFGEVNPGDGSSSPDVFRIINVGATDVQIDIIPRGGFEDLVGRVRLGNQLLPAALSSGDERSVEIDLDISENAAPGDYTGTIRVSATDGSFSVEIPALVTVVAKDETKAVDPPETAQVEPEPSTADPSLLEPTPAPSGDAGSAADTCAPGGDDGSAVDTPTPSGGAGSTVDTAPAGGGGSAEAPPPAPSTSSG